MADDDPVPGSEAERLGDIRLRFGKIPSEMSIIREDRRTIGQPTSHVDRGGME
jgi:hypothetical protein